MNPLIHYIIEMIGATTVIALFCLFVIGGINGFIQNRRNKDRQVLLDKLEKKRIEYEYKDEELFLLLTRCIDWVDKIEDEDNCC